MALSEQEKAELLAVVSSPSMKADSQRLQEERINPFVIDGVVDCDRVLEFLTEFNEFLGHPVNEHWRFVEKDMKL
jgi:hypothetical protein